MADDVYGVKDVRREDRLLFTDPGQVMSTEEVIDVR